MVNFNRIPIHKDITIPKSELRRLPKEFLPTSLGYDQEGEVAQYRGPDGLHAHEFKDHWTIHRDYFDPRTVGGAIGHAVKDAPEVAVGAIAAAVVGAGMYQERK